MDGLEWPRVQQCHKYSVSIREYHIWLLCCLKLYWVYKSGFAEETVFGEMHNAFTLLLLFAALLVRENVSNFSSEINISWSVFKLYNTLQSSETVCVLQQRQMSLFLCKHTQYVIAKFLRKLSPILVLSVVCVDCNSCVLFMQCHTIKDLIFYYYLSKYFSVS